MLTFGILSSSANSSVRFETYSSSEANISVYFRLLFSKEAACSFKAVICASTEYSRSFLICASSSARFLSSLSSSENSSSDKSPRERSISISSISRCIISGELSTVRRRSSNSADSFSVSSFLNRSKVCFAFCSVSSISFLVSASPFAFFKIRSISDDISAFALANSSSVSVTEQVGHLEPGLSPSSFCLSTVYLTLRPASSVSSFAISPENFETYSRSLAAFSLSSSAAAKAAVGLFTAEVSFSESCSRRFLKSSRFKPSNCFSFSICTVAAETSACSFSLSHSALFACTVSRKVALLVSNIRSCSSHRRIPAL